MNNGNTWSRCAGRFLPPFEKNKPLLQTAKVNPDSAMRQIHVERLDFNENMASSGGIQQTDLALASLGKMQTMEFVAQWIVREICTPSNSEPSISCPSSPMAGSLSQNQRQYSPQRQIGSDPYSAAVHDLEESPIVESRRHFISRPSESMESENKDKVLPDLTRSPIVGKFKIVEDRRNCNHSMLNEYQNTPVKDDANASDVKKSPILGSRQDPVGKKYQRLKRKRLRERLNFSLDNKSDGKEITDLDESLTGYRPVKLDSCELSQDIFEEDQISQRLKSFQKSSNGDDQSKLSVGQERRHCEADTSEEMTQNLGLEGKQHLSSPVFKSRVKRGRSCYKSKRELQDLKANPSNVKMEKIDRFKSCRNIFHDEQISGTLQKLPAIFTSNIHEKVADSETSKKNIKTGILEAEFNSSMNNEFALNSSNYSPPRYKEEHKHLTSPIIRNIMRNDRSFSNLHKLQESFCSFIEDTEPMPPSISQQNLQKDKFMILDSEFVFESKVPPTDTERIEFDISSATEEDNTHLLEKLINEAESESDKTVSDLIEEPVTQNCPEPSQPTAVLSLESIQTASLKISDTMSQKEHLLPAMSVIDISVESSPPRTPKQSTIISELLDSAKKKKRRCKKGGLSARLQKLVGSQLSNIRIWRHQMSRQSLFEGPPCTTLLVTESWQQYGNNLYRCTMVEDPFNLLKDYLHKSAANCEQTVSECEDLVVMTTPNYVGPVIMLKGTVFKVYLPWKIFNRNSDQGNLILHALYFTVVSNPVKVELEQNLHTESKEDKKECNKQSVVTHQYDCSCLQYGRVDNSCLIKFTNHQKIDVISEIFK